MENNEFNGMAYNPKTAKEELRKKIERMKKKERKEIMEVRYTTQKGEKVEFRYDEEIWRTIRGQKVLIKDGVFQNGALAGQKYEPKTTKKAKSTKSYSSGYNKYDIAGSFLNGKTESDVVDAFTNAQLLGIISDEEYCRFWELDSKTMSEKGVLSGRYECPWKDEFQALIKSRLDKSYYPPITRDEIKDLSYKELIEYVTNAKCVDDPTLATNLSQRLCQMLGMNDKPKVISHKEFQRLSEGKKVLYRGVGDYETITAEMINNQTIRGNKTYYGTGVAGDGIYFTPDEGEAMGYGADVSGCYNIMRCIVDESKIKAIEIDELIQSTGEEAKNDSNWSLVALQKGYNTIRFGSYYNVLDRGILICDRETLNLEE